MDISFDLRKSVSENAKEHYEKSKKYRGKLQGMVKAIADSKRKLESCVEEDVSAAPRVVKRRQRRWFEPFRWFVSSQGYLVIGGRDATSNEILVKKHLEPSDRVFHANVHGAPFFIVKNPNGGDVPPETLSEASEAAASYSKAWGKGLGSADVYEVAPEQISKTPPSGEYLPKGSFMVYGEKVWYKNVTLRVTVGLSDDEIIGGPVDSVSSKTKNYVVLGIGDISQGKLAKIVKSKLGGGELDDIQGFLPGGGGKIM